jgi:hypothetical protein
MNAIAKWTGVSTPAVHKWIRDHVKENYPRPALGAATIVEIVELWHFLENITASSGSGRLIVVIQGDSLTGSAGIVITLPSNN